MAMTEHDGKEYLYQWPIGMEEIQFEDGKIVMISRPGVSKHTQIVTGSFLDLKGLSKRYRYGIPKHFVAGDTLNITQDFELLEL